MIFYIDYMLEVKVAVVSKANFDRLMVNID